MKKRNCILFSKIQWLLAVLLFICIQLSCHKKVVPVAIQETVLLQQKVETDSLSFIVLGDWGRHGRQHQQAVAQQMSRLAQQHRIQFLISTGDNFYPRGVSGTEDPQWKSSFEQVYHQPGLQVSWYAVLGNHDYQTNPKAQVAYTSINSRWQMPARYYVVRKQISDSSSVLFTFTDTSPFVPMYYNRHMADLPVQDTALQLRWLRQELTSATDTWKITVGHHPLYSAGKHGNTFELIERFKPLLLQSGTDFYLSGHDHSLQYNRVPNETVRYLVSGGGSERTRVRPNSYSVFSRSSPGFLMMTLYPASARFYFYDHKGRLLYQQQIHK